MDASVTILAGAITALGKASGGVYRKPASFNRLRSLAECSNMPDTGRILTAAQGSSAAMCPEEFTMQFRSGLLNSVGDFAGNELIQRIFHLVDDWNQHTQRMNAVVADAHVAVDAITTMRQESEHSCEQMATQAANSVDKVCAMLNGINLANNPDQVHNLVTLGGAAIDSAITSSCGVYEHRNCGISKVLHGHVDMLDHMHSDVATSPASVHVGNYDMGNGGEMQFAAESMAELRANVQASVDVGIQQAHQILSDFIPDPIPPIPDPGVTPEETASDASAAVTVTAPAPTPISDGGADGTEPESASCEEPISSPESPVMDSSPTPAEPPVESPVEPIPDPAPAPPETPAPPEPVAVDPPPESAPPPQVTQQCIPVTPEPPAPVSAPEPSPAPEPIPKPLSGFQPHKAGAWL